MQLRLTSIILQVCHVAVHVLVCCFQTKYILQISDGEWKASHASYSSTATTTSNIKDSLLCLLCQSQRSMRNFSSNWIFTDYHHDVSILIQNTHQVYSCQNNCTASNTSILLAVTWIHLIVLCIKAGTIPVILSKYAVSPMQSRFHLIMLKDKHSLSGFCQRLAWSAWQYTICITETSCGVSLAA